MCDHICLPCIGWLPNEIYVVHSRPRAKFFSIRTDQGQEITYLFFLLSFTNENRTVCRNVCMPSAGFRRVKSDKCQVRIKDWQSSIQTEEMVMSDELVYCFYHFRTLTSQVGQSSQRLNSCVVKIYLRIGDVYASNSSTEFQLYGFQRNLERDWALWATWFDVRVEFSKSWSKQTKRKVHDSNLEKILFTLVGRGFPVKSSVWTARVGSLVYWKTALQMSWTGWMYECRIP